MPVRKLPPPHPTPSHPFFICQIPPQAPLCQPLHPLSPALQPCSTCPTHPQPPSCGAPSLPLRKTSPPPCKCLTPHTLPLPPLAAPAPAPTAGSTASQLLRPLGPVAPRPAPPRACPLQQFDYPAFISTEWYQTNTMQAYVKTVNAFARLPRTHTNLNITVQSLLKPQAAETDANTVIWCLGNCQA